MVYISDCNDFRCNAVLLDIEFWTESFRNGHNRSDDIYDAILFLLGKNFSIRQELEARKDRVGNRYASFDFISNHFAKSILDRIHVIGFTFLAEQHRIHSWRMASSLAFDYSRFDDAFYL